jgi:prepilin-type N-terminal cleavage/methylation domain-containing protein
MTRRTSGRRGFSLLEVMIAIAILVMSFTVLMELEITSVKMTREAERLVVASNLAQEQTAQVMVRLEKEGFQEQDVCDAGDFEEFGDEALDLEFGDTLKAYHWEYCISTIDLSMAGDLAGMAGSLAGQGYFGDAGTSGSADIQGAIGGMGLGNFMSGDMITEMLGRYVREVRVRVWWGDDSKAAEENDDEVVVVTHAINPTGVVVAANQMGANPTAGQ